MKNKLLLLVISVLCMQCSDDSTAIADSDLFPQLTKVTTATHVYQQFEYNTDGRLAKESLYLTSCEVPTSVYSYSYTGHQLTSVNNLDRISYSSTSAVCDPSSGLKTEFYFEYDEEGRIVKVIYPASFTELEYNSQDQISKLSVSANGKIMYLTKYTYDAGGNILTETDQTGATINYKYDNKINPYYLIKQRPHLISPFNTSPNNVIEASGGRSFKRSFKYNSQSLPTEVVEDNSITYTFHYN